jgi:hypothetical protein
LIDQGIVKLAIQYPYCSSVFLLAAVLLMGWRFEAFWRSLDAGGKWQYKYLVVCLFLICAMLGWSSSYRLAYLSLPRDHFLLRPPPE